MYESGVARGRSVTLGLLLDALGGAGLLATEADASGEENTEGVIDHLTADSRRVGPNGMFVALRGETTDGHLFIDKAVDNGAIAIVYEATPAESHHFLPGVALVPVVDSHAALGVLAAAYFGDAASRLRIVGVTGTNGKTTTAWLLYQALSALEPPSGLIGTIEYRTPTGSIPATHTTPDALHVHALLAEIHAAGGRSCAMEVSSHALAQRRVSGVRFSAAVFTNLTQDHLDYHHDMTGYLAAKRLLFESLHGDAVAVVNADDPYAADIVAATKVPVTTYGTTRTSDIRFQLLENAIDGLTIRLEGETRRFAFAGRFNAYNLVAAYATMRALGYEAAPAMGALEAATPAPGRFEPIALPHGPTVIVDYAHTPDALENVLGTISECAGNDDTEVWCVFGCGGDRDRSKRPIMGRIAEEGADHVIVTDDNPRGEASEDIFADIRKGMAEPERAHWIADRRAAITRALAASTPTDVVLVAGKGHETYQVYGTTRSDFDDRLVVRETWKQLSEKN